MAITDRQRTELHKACEELMGQGPADTLMASLPPVGWADVATKHDLGELESRMTKEFAMVRLELDSKLNAVRVEISSLRADLAHDMRGWFFALVASFAVLLALATAASRLAG